MHAHSSRTRSRRLPFRCEPVTRAKLALALGVATYAAAWAFGSGPLYPVAAALVLAVLVAAVWVRLAVGRNPPALTRTLDRTEPREGDDVGVRLQLWLDGTFPPPNVTVVEEFARIGEVRTELRAQDHALVGEYVLHSLPRGRYTIESATSAVGDPFGLVRTTAPLDSGAAFLVYPRLVELDTLFTDAGGRLDTGRRLLLRRPAGFDLHSVREYEEGESLRRVHWPSTARRGELMVKELEDAPRDELAVLLDADARAVAGEPPDSSFDAQVRAAGSVLQAHVRRGRRCVLLTTSDRGVRRVNTDGGWHRALELLAGVEPSDHGSAATLLADESGAATRALDLVIVTACLDRGLVDRIVRRSLARRGSALVYVDAPSFAGAVRRPEPELLRLNAAGVRVAVVRRGDDLATALSGRRIAEAALA
jgi:uncharacterized protein (DUF58 family)